MADQGISIDIKKFEVRGFKPGNVIMVLGARGCGKSTMVKELMFHLRNYDAGVMMVGTLDTAAEFSKHFPDSLIYDEFRGDVINNIIVDQERRMRKNQLNGISLGKIPSRFVILDDLGADKSFNSDKSFIKLLMNGRHYRTTIILSLQYVIQLNKSNRCQVDYVFATFEKAAKYRRAIFEEFDVGFGDLATFEATMGAIVTDYNVMVLDRRSNMSTKISDSVYYIRAKLGRNFLMCPKLWKIHRENYNPIHLSKVERDAEATERASVVTRRAQAALTVRRIPDPSLRRRLISKAARRRVVHL